MGFWIELIKLLKTRGLQPVLLGGPEEIEMSARLVAETGCLASGVQPLETFYAMIERCECVVSAVTMAMHLAIGARTPLVLLNNIFNRYEFELYGRGEIVEPLAPCDCYYSGVCRTGRKCINEILPAFIAPLEWAESATFTFAPASRRRSTRCEPMKPRPPVTTTFFCVQKDILL
jgi:hypothetical protein